MNLDFYIGNYILENSQKKQILKILTSSKLFRRCNQRERICLYD